jgi:hypothetical protein
MIEPRGRASSDRAMWASACNRGVQRLATMKVQVKAWFREPLHALHALQGTGSSGSLPLVESGPTVPVSAWHSGGSRRWENARRLPSGRPSRGSGHVLSDHFFERRESLRVSQGLAALAVPLLPR